MFKKGAKTKLQLHKETLRRLTRTELEHARGGVCAISDGDPGVPTENCTACAASIPASRVVNTALYPCGAR